MKLLIRKIYLFLLNFVSTLTSCIRIVIHSKKNEITKLSRKSQCALILGNGPSLTGDMTSLIKFSKIKQCDIWAVNDFALTQTFFLIKPKFYVIADPNYWVVDTVPELIKLRDQLFEVFNKHVSWPIVLFVPLRAKDYGLENKIASDNVKIVFFNSTPITGFVGFQYWTFSRQFGMVSAYNVLVAAIALALCMRYPNLYIGGADHSWHEELSVDLKGVPHIKQKHFYNEEDSQAIPFYKNSNETFTIAELFLGWGNLFLQYAILNRYARSIEAKIYNVSSKTYIDAFARLSINKLDK